jgi:hypothetical protein
LITQNLKLGWLSIIFDIIFLVQHYCLYSSQAVYDTAEDTIQSNQNEPLLPAVENDVANECGEEELQEKGGPLSEPAQPQTIFV